MFQVILTNLTVLDCPDLKRMLTKRELCYLMRLRWIEFFQLILIIKMEMMLSRLNK